LISGVVPPKPPKLPRAFESNPSVDTSIARRSPSAMNEPTTGGSLANGTAASNPSSGVFPGCCRRARSTKPLMSK
jgi:hypothetical protein